MPIVNPYLPNFRTTLTSPVASAQIRDNWAEHWLETLRERTLPFSKIGTPQVIASNSGNAVTFHDMPALPVVTTNLTEGTTPDPTVPVTSTVQGVTVQRGMYIAVSDRVWKESMMNLMSEVTHKVNENLQDSVEAYHYSQACAGGNVFRGDGTVTTDATITAAMTLKVATLRKLQRKCLAAHVPPDTDGYWKLVISPGAALSLESDPEWIAMSQADKNKSADAERGEIGRLYNFKIIVTTVVAVRDNGAGVNVNDCIAYGGSGFKRIQITGEGPEVIVKEPGKDGGPLNQRGTVGWKCVLGSKITQDPCVIRVTTAEPA